MGVEELGERKIAVGEVFHVLVFLRAGFLAPGGGRRIVFEVEVIADLLGGGHAVEVPDLHDEIDVRVAFVAGEAMPGVVGVEVERGTLVLVERAMHDDGFAVFEGLVDGFDVHAEYV
jgi:hypothetical protein